MEFQNLEVEGKKLFKAIDSQVGLHQRILCAQMRLTGCYTAAQEEAVYSWPTQRATSTIVIVGEGQRSNFESKGKRVK